MDGVAYQGMARIALTSEEEALVPRPPSSASQVATAIPSTYSRHAHGYGHGHGHGQGQGYGHTGTLSSPPLQPLSLSSPASPSGAVSAVNTSVIDSYRAHPHHRNRHTSITHHPYYLNSNASNSFSALANSH